MACNRYEIECERVDEHNGLIEQTLMRGFRINGYVNQHPDLIAQTRSGKVLVIDTKADYNRNADDAKNKLHQGRRWQEKAGENFRFYMVESKEMGSEGAFTLQSFLKMVEGS